MRLTLLSAILIGFNRSSGIVVSCTSSGIFTSPLSKLIKITSGGYPNKVKEKKSVREAMSISLMECFMHVKANLFVQLFQKGLVHSMYERSGSLDQRFKASRDQHTGELANDRR